MNLASGPRITIATRGSALARWQAGAVAARLGAARPGLRCELLVVDTAGDRIQDRPIPELGGQGVFVKEVQSAVLAGRADIAVHSAKDLPSLPTEGLVIAAYPERADPRDALVGADLAGLAEGATVATGSVRRRAQLAVARGDLRFADLRGNIATRLAKVPPGGAVVVALAALTRLGLADRAAEVLDPGVVLPQVGQGALAVECREGDQAVAGLLDELDDLGVRAEVEAERAFLACLGGGCDLPVGALARVAGAGMEIEALVVGSDGVARRGRRRGPTSTGEDLGRDLAAELVGPGGPTRR